jgi:hypothetical protein
MRHIHDQVEHEEDSAKFKTMFDNSQDGLVILASDVQRIEYINDSFLKTLNKQLDKFNLPEIHENKQNWLAK